jgi:ribonuclease R
VAFAGLSMPDFTLAQRDTRGASDGDRVVVVATDAAKRPPGTAKRRGRRRAAGIPVRVVEVLGPAGDPDSDHRAIVWRHRVTRSFPRRARLESDSIPAAISPRDREARLDLRHLPFITIDPATARDHDDAVFAEQRTRETLSRVDSTGERSAPRSSAGWTHRLWVAIADVAHFVRPAGAIDAEARRRGNSFYFPDRAIPMLPERLSTELCSLHPDLDRLAVVVELRLLADGRIADALFHEAVIRSHAQLSYEQAAGWLSKPDASDAPAWGESLLCLDRIARRLFAARRKAGAIGLELPEIRIEFDASGRPVDAVLRERNAAHSLIEEAMLAANRAVAAALDHAGRPTLHRVHPPPRDPKLAALSLLLDRLALGDGADLSEPGAIARVLETVRGTACEERVHVAALRAMSQARYEADARGHYALRFDHYLHFTSPIRRYADLEVHRALKHLIRAGSRLASAPSRDGEAISRLAVWLSGRERVAVAVERDAESLACCAILQGREGERFRARVSSVSEFGLFIRTESPAVQGLVPIRTLEGEWRHDVDEEMLVGPRSGSQIGLGDALEVRLLEVDSDRGRLAFRIDGSDLGAPRAGRRARSRQSSSV